jgi:hypothetical protein
MSTDRLSDSTHVIEGTAGSPRRIVRRDRISRAGMAEGSVASEKGRAAEEVLNAKARFGIALSNKRKYPLDESRLFARAARNYTGVTAGDALIHRKVVGEISGLADYLRLNRNEFRTMFYSSLTGCSASCSPDTIRASRATNPQVCEEEVLRPRLLYFPISGLFGPDPFVQQCRTMETCNSGRIAACSNC